MEVIEETKIVKCKDCHSQLKFTSKDIETTWITNDPFVRCPVCGNRIFILYADIKTEEK